MYKVVAEKGNINVDLDLTDLINESKSIINDKDTHNRKALDNLDNLVNSYIEELNKVLNDNNLTPKFECKGGINGFRCITLGHGLSNIRIELKINFNSESGLYENNIIGKFSTYKNWLYAEKEAVKEIFELESVGQVLEKGLDCIKINHLVDALNHNEYTLVKRNFQY